MLYFCNSYDYTGYGCSQGGGVGEKHAYGDAHAVYTHLVTVLGIRADNIVLFGRSMGA